jgi:hypothetical protein
MELTNTSETITRGRQDVHIVRLGERDERKFRSTVKRDSYDFQSYAKVELWTPAGWTEVVSLRGDNAVMADLPSYAVPADKRDAANDAMRQVARMLETQAEEITR